MEVNDVDNCGESKQEKDLRDISTTTVMDPLSRSPSETSEMARRFSIDSGISSPSSENSRRRSLGTQTPSGSMLFDFSFDSSDPGHNNDDEEQLSDIGDDLRPRSTTVSFPVRRRGSITVAEIEKFKQNMTSSSGMLSTSAPASDADLQRWKHSGTMLRALADDYSNMRAFRPRRNSEPYCKII